MKRTLMLLSMGTVLVSLLGLAGNAAAGKPTLTADNNNLSPQLRRVPVDHRDVYDLPEVRVWTSVGNGATVFPGESMKVNFRTNQNAFVVVLNVDTRGRVSKLFPTRRFDDGFVRGGRTVRLPERGARYRLMVGGPPGVERVIAFASDEPIAHRWRSLLDDMEYGLHGDAGYGVSGNTAWEAAATIRTNNASIVLTAGDKPRLERQLIPVPVDNLDFTVSETWFRVVRPGRHVRIYR